jgi:EAL domain-containing protein (putative c-di-GMP-specific phosphodiesterase class I)
MRLLLLDDDPFALRLLARQLAQLGADDVICCASANEALGALDGEDGRFDAMFFDLNMPGMDGVELLRHLAGRHFRGGLVLISGEDQRVLQTVAALARAHRLRLAGTLHKPVSPLQLAPVVEGLPLGPRNTDFTPLPAGYTVDEVRAGIDAGQLLNLYQPQVDLASSGIVAVEALVRWQHPHDGLLGPDRFVPVAEAGGLSGALTRAVLGAGLRDAAGWHAAGLGVRLSVNVSMRDLVALDFPDEVERELGAAGLAAGGLLLEITETQLSRDRVALLDIVTRLRLKRIGLAIDDYGTGYSTLSLLRDVPFDELKIDRGFVSGLADSTALQAMVEANIAMAHQLGMRTVGEGVERVVDLERLRALGCDLAQGYLIARPMPAAELADWIARWNAQRPMARPARA